MKSVRRYLFVIVAIAGLLYVGSDAGSLTTASGGAQTEIEKKIYKEILILPYYGVFDHILFEVDGGRVILSGKVYSLGLAKNAERSVKKIPGVTEVVNNIEMLPPSSYDNAIRRQTIGSFSRDGGSLSRYLIEPQPAIRIIVDGGRITLEGSVANRGDYQLAGILANGVPGVFKVENNLNIENAVR